MLLILAAIIISGLCFGISARAAITDDVNQKNQQIEEIQRQIEQYQQQIDTIHDQALTLQRSGKYFKCPDKQDNLGVEKFKFIYYQH